MLCPSSITERAARMLAVRAGNPPQREEKRDYEGRGARRRVLATGPCASARKVRHNESVRARKTTKNLDEKGMCCYQGARADGDVNASRADTLARQRARKIEARVPANVVHCNPLSRQVHLLHDCGIPGVSSQHRPHGNHAPLPSSASRGAPGYTT